MANKIANKSTSSLNICMPVQIPNINKRFTPSNTYINIPNISINTDMFNDI